MSEIQLRRLGHAMQLLYTDNFDSIAKTKCHVIIFYDYIEQCNRSELFVQYESVALVNDIFNLFHHIVSHPEIIRLLNTPSCPTTFSVQSPPSDDPTTILFDSEHSELSYQTTSFNNDKILTLICILIDALILVVHSFWKCPERLTIDESILHLVIQDFLTILHVCSDAKNAIYRAEKNEAFCSSLEQVTEFIQYVSHPDTLPSYIPDDIHHCTDVSDNNSQISCDSEHHHHHHHAGQSCHSHHNHELNNENDHHHHSHHPQHHHDHSDLIDFTDIDLRTDIIDNMMLLLNHIMKDHVESYRIQLLLFISFVSESGFYRLTAETRFFTLNFWSQLFTSHQPFFTIIENPISIKSLPSTNFVQTPSSENQHQHNSPLPVDDTNLHPHTLVDSDAYESYCESYISILTYAMNAFLRYIAHDGWNHEHVHFESSLVLLDKIILPWLIGTLLYCPASQHMRKSSNCQLESADAQDIGTNFIPHAKIAQDDQPNHFNVLQDAIPNDLMTFLCPEKLSPQQLASLRELFLRLVDFNGVRLLQRVISWFTTYHTLEHQPDITHDLAIVRLRMSGLEILCSTPGEDIETEHELFTTCVLQLETIQKHQQSHEHETTIDQSHPQSDSIQESLEQPLWILEHVDHFAQCMKICDTILYLLEHVEQNVLKSK